ncbi:putative ATP-dependent endonuclease of OLD family [Alteromonadaceae bacterium 2753L.S.0a.02]|nr:putative ATP-dependent endonuclease of OLD family [Alteromonadaceae bacterium 2753L.S.0a.02]
MRTIKRVKLHNFKKFQKFEIPLDEKLNILVGENESGKSSILTAIALVLSGNRLQIEKLGFERLINKDVVDAFLQTDKRYEDLPTTHIELWLNEQNDEALFGRNNSETTDCDGLRMDICPRDEYSREIIEILNEEEVNFPFEFYQVKFSTFQGDAYSGYKKFLRHILIDTSQIGNEYAVREYVGDMYNTWATDIEIAKHQFEYRQAKSRFELENLNILNDRVADYSFALKSDSKSNLKTDLTIIEGDIGIENKGKGKQCFIKTEFALKKSEGIKHKIDIALIEEPENHLSHVNMKKLVSLIGASNDKQLIIATHSNMISSRLDLRNTILLHPASSDPVRLNDLSDETAEFFIKAPYHEILDFVLSSKVILVEGDSEYILMDKLYEMHMGHKADHDNVHIFSVGGTSFKRYLEVSALLNIKTAVIRDNDGDHDANCVQLYEGCLNDSNKIFADPNDERHTLEVCLYEDNTDFCNGLFSEGRRTLTAQEWMLKNKAEAALKILENIKDDFQTPKYIRDAIQWISA